MLYISEWLPNPVGPDAEGEWVEIHNAGSEPVALAGWRLENGAGKSVRLSGALGPGEYKVFPRSATKLTLRNQDEKLILRDPSGQAVHESAWPGRAVEGKSVALSGGTFLLAEPTPGAPNAAPATAVLDHSPPPGLVSSVWGTPEMAGIGLLVSAALAGAVLFLVYRNNDLRKLFFPGD